MVCNSKSTSRPEIFPDNIIFPYGNAAIAVIKSAVAGTLAVEPHTITDLYLQFGSFKNCIHARISELRLAVVVVRSRVIAGIFSDIIFNIRAFPLKCSAYFSSTSLVHSFVVISIPSFSR